VNQVCRVNTHSRRQRGRDTFLFTERKDSAEGMLCVFDARRVSSIRALVAAKGRDMNQRVLTDIVRAGKAAS